MPSSKRKTGRKRAKQKGRRYGWVDKLPAKDVGRVKEVTPLGLVYAKELADNRRERREEALSGDPARAPERARACARELRVAGRPVPDAPRASDPALRQGPERLDHLLPAASKPSARKPGRAALRRTGLQASASDRIDVAPALLRLPWRLARARREASRMQACRRARSEELTRGARLKTRYIPRFPRVLAIPYGAPSAPASA